MLIAVQDDATKRVLYAQLWRAKRRWRSWRPCATVVAGGAADGALYGSRPLGISHAPGEGARGREPLTQVGRALARLGIEHIPAYSPQARGRSERLNRTSRIASSTSCAWPPSRRWRRPIGICTSASCPSTTPRSAVRRATRPVRLCRRARRPRSDSLPRRGARRGPRQHGLARGRVFPTRPRNAAAARCAGLRVTVRRHLDGQYSIGAAAAARPLPRRSSAP